MSGEDMPIPKRRRRIVRTTAGLLAFTILAAGGYWIAGFARGPERAIASGRASVAAVREFDGMFPAAEHSISYFTGTHGPPTWNAKAALYGRYVITMQLPVRFNAMGRDRITWGGPPTFTLVEVDRIEIGPSGTASLVYGDTRVKFGAAEWARFVKAGGDFGVIGVGLQRDRPVPLFDRYWRSG